MIYAELAIIVATLVFSATCFFILLKRVETVEKMCERNMETIARHAAEHVRMAEEQDEVASRIADQIEKKWDTGLQKMLEWNPFMTKEGG